MKSIACNMEAKTKGHEALLSLKMGIKMEKKKAIKIANLDYDGNLGIITKAEFKLQVRVVLGLESKQAIA